MKWKRFWLISLGITFLLCIPLIIEKVNPLYITAGDALAFWGAIIGASVAIVGVYLSFKQSQEKFEDERILNVLPVITISEITGIWQNYNEVSYNDLYFKDKIDSNEPNIDENLLKSMDEYQTIFFIQEEHVYLAHHFSKEEKAYILSNFMTAIMNDEKVPYIYAPFYFTNSGMGTAVNLIIYIAREYEIDGKKEITPLCNSLMKSIKVGEEFMVTFFAPRHSDKNSSEYIVTINYSDIYSTEYTQIHRFKFHQNYELFNLDTTIGQMKVKN